VADQEQHNESGPDLSDASGEVVESSGLDDLSDGSGGLSPSDDEGGIVHGGGHALHAQRQFRDYIAQLPPVERRNALRSHQRHVLRLERAVEKRKTAHDAVAQRWNAKALRHGERLQASGGQTDFLHPRSWSAAGVCDFALRRIGTTHGKLQRLSHRGLDALACVALALARYQEDHVKQFLLSLVSGVVKPSYIWIQRSWDETPVNAKFGLCTDLARPIARYWAYEGEMVGSSSSSQGCWVRLTHEEYIRRGLGREPSSGSLQMMAQTIVVHWAVPMSGDAKHMHEHHKEVLLMPPVFMARNNASSLFQALEDTLPQLCWTSLVALTEHVQCVVLSLVGDLDSANVRLKHEFGRRAREHNASADGAGHGRIFVLDIACTAHIIHRMVETRFKTEELVPKLHSIAFVCNQTRTYEQILVVLRCL
jgi:hypothetical protein